MIRPTFTNNDTLASSNANAGVSLSFSRWALEYLVESLIEFMYSSLNVTLLSDWPGRWSVKTLDVSEKIASRNGLGSVKC